MAYLYKFALFDKTGRVCENYPIGVKPSDDEIEANRPYLKVDYSDQTGIHRDLVKFDVSPNPFNDYININLDNISCYSITNVNRQKVKAEYITSKHPGWD